MNRRLLGDVVAQLFHLIAGLDLLLAHLLHFGHNRSEMVWMKPRAEKPAMMQKPTKMKISPAPRETHRHPG